MDTDMPMVGDKYESRINDDDLTAEIVRAPSEQAKNAGEARV